MDSGTRLNHYEIVAPLGAGGMGQVYRAEDTRLKRQVAIKDARHDRGKTRRRRRPEIQQLSDQA